MIDGNWLLGGSTVPTARQVLYELIQIRQQVRRKQATERLRALLFSLRRRHPEASLGNETAEERAIIAISYLAEAHDRTGLVPESAWTDAINRAREWARTEV